MDYLEFLDKEELNDEELFKSQSQINNSDNSSPLSQTLIDILSTFKYPFMHYLCQKCWNLPCIEFIDEYMILYSCACIKREKISINKLLDKKNKYCLFEIIEPDNSESSDQSGIGTFNIDDKNIKMIEFVYKCKKHINNE